MDFPRALLAGLEARLVAAPPEDWARLHLVVNTRRMTRRLRNLLDNGPPRLLPRLSLVTDLGECGPANCWLISNGGVLTEVRLGGAGGTWVLGDCIHFVAPLNQYDDELLFDMFNFDTCWFNTLLHSLLSSCSRPLGLRIQLTSSLSMSRLTHFNII